MSGMRITAVGLLLVPILLASNAGSWADSSESPKRFDKVMPLAMPTIPGLKNPTRNWDNTLEIGRGEILLSLKGGASLRIEPKRVTAVRYGSRRTPREGAVWLPAMLGGAAGIIVTLALRQSLPETEHYIFMEFDLENGRPSVMVLRADKDNVAGILEAFQEVTNPDPNRPDPSPRDPLGCGPPGEKLKGRLSKDEHPAPEASAGKAVLYWYWRGNPGNYMVGLNGNWIGRSWRNAYFFAEVDPGTVKVCIETSNAYFVMPLPFVAEAGRTYYFGSGKTEEEHKRLIQSLSYVTFAPEQ
jgi:hypothetical protein